MNTKKLLSFLLLIGVGIVLVGVYFYSKNGSFFNIAPKAAKVDVVQKPTPKPTCEQNCNKIPSSDARKRCLTSCVVQKPTCCSVDSDCLAGKQKCVGRSTRCSNSPQGGYCVAK